MPPHARGGARAPDAQTARDLADGLRRLVGQGDRRQARQQFQDGEAPRDGHSLRVRGANAVGTFCDGDWTANDARRLTMWMLVLNMMRNRMESMTNVAYADTKEQLEAFLVRETVPDYTEEGPDG